MSDSFQSYVFAELVDGRDGFDRVKNWLLGEKVIEDTMAENGLGEEGHLPGSRASSILIEDNEHWRSLSENGVVFSVGQIIEASADLRSGCCPDCNNDFPVDSAAFSVIDDALSAFGDGGSGMFFCPHCRREVHLSDWDFGGALAVGTEKLTFWNWPDHVPDLRAHFRKLSDMRCTMIVGKL